jgi:hypothetical protein
MEKDKLQPQRFELKYLVNEDVALAMRDFVRCYLVPDEFAALSPTLDYPNHSLYLDSDDLQLYWDVVNGNKNRYKLRLRYYDDNPAAPVFFEIKRRSDNAILKERGAVRRDFVASLLAGHLPEPTHLVSNNPKHLAALQHFCRLMHDCAAKPKTHVCYRREAWMSAADNSVRVTFDREVCSVPHTEPVISTHVENPVMPWGRLVILELKFTTRFPNWFFEMVRLFNAMQCGVAKYAEGVALLGEAQLNPLFHVPEQADVVEKFLREHRQPRPGDPSPQENDKSKLVWTTS